MKLVLKSLEMLNFKERSEVLIKVDFDPKRTTLVGTNGVGKTRSFDAFCWLLTGCDSLGAATFEKRPRTDRGEVIHHRDVSVVGYFELDGEPLVLEKKWLEKWVTKKGVETFDGCNSACFIDGVPAPSSKYDEFVSAIVDKAKFKLCTDAMAFHNLESKVKRELLAELYAAFVKNPQSDMDIIKSNAELAGLELGKYSVDDYKKVLTEKRKRLKESLKVLPARISEAGESLAPLVDIKTCQSRIDVLTHTLQTGDATTPIVAQISAVKRRIDEAQMDFESAQRRLQSDYEFQKRKSQVLEVELARKAEAVGRLTTSLHSLTVDYKILMSSEIRTDDTCPTCEQDLSAEKVNFAKAEAERGRQKNLQDIADRGKALKQQQNELELVTVDIERDLAELRSKLAEPTTELFTPSKADLEELKKLEAELAEAKPLDDEPLKVELAKLQQDLAKVELNKSQQERIEQLKTDLTAAQSESETVEQQFLLLEQLSLIKAKILEEGVNQIFTYTQFKLFEQKVDGEFIECCKSLHDGNVVHDGLNRGAVFNTALEMSSVLSQLYGVSLPLFLDNTESLDFSQYADKDLLKYDRQLVLMEVDTSVKKLEVKHG